MEFPGIYIHIPFCVQKCAYCAFASARPRSSCEMADYTEALCREIRAFGRAHPGLRARTLYVGGGTPSMLAVDQMEALVATLGQTFDLTAAAERTIEVNPASAMKEKLAAYRALGFNRLSIGLQAYQDRLLKLLGRAHSARDFDTTWEHALEAGFINLSADVIFGLPTQSLADLEGTLTALVNRPGLTHLSCYSLSVEPGTPMETAVASGRLTLPDEAIERQMYHTLIKRLEASGLGQYEISNFARPGFESRHNSAYWDLTPYIGFGLGASSYYNEVRWTNTLSLDAYLKDPAGAPKSEAHQMSVTEQRGDFMFLGLRRKAGVDDRCYRAKFGTSFFADYGPEIQNLLEVGLVEKRGGTLRLTPLGMDLANQVFIAFV
jgi:oxygen-independent coproporphyrinogen-3 oxidase